jgi:L(+)-tartrate dehydratase beta subunit
VKRLRAPLAEADVVDLRLGDEVYLDGTVHLLRDATHHRIFEEHVAPPVSLAGSVVLHAAPSFRQIGERYEILSVGATTSMRVDRYTPELVERYGVRAVVGKGGMGPATAAAMHRAKAVYLALVGGASALVTSQVEAVEGRWWPDLLGEALWQVRVKELGPAIVAIDTSGQNRFDEVQREARRRLDEIAAGP